MEPYQFGNYTLLERISHGGMAEVFRAKSFGEAGFEREVALKLLLPAIATDQEFVNMLIDEAKIAGQLNHANIAQIFDLGVTDDRYYIVQEYVNGQDLRAILKHKAETNSRLEISSACHIALKVCEGLHYAHNKEDPSGRPLNLVHRDISPHNILISNEGEVKIIDFGIAKAEGRSTQTMAGLVKGKFAYMSPEQIRGLPVDHRSDVFATGILLHEMLTNKPLFRRSSEFETLKRARAATAEAPSKFNPKVPSTLDKIVLKALARHVDDRYQSAREFRDELWAFAREHNAFYYRENLANMNARPSEKLGSANRSSIEIELASEVSAVRELTSAGVEAEETDLEAEVTDSDSSTIVEADAPTGGETTEEATADPNENFTPTDHDAQWAADVAGPLSSSPFTLPTRNSLKNKPKQVSASMEDEEETTNDQVQQHEDSTDRFGRPTPAHHPKSTFTPPPAQPLDLDDSTAEQVPRRDREKTVPAMPDKEVPTQPLATRFARSRGKPETPYDEATTNENRLKIGLATTEPIVRSTLLASAQSLRENSARNKNNSQPPHRTPPPQQNSSSVPSREPSVAPPSAMLPRPPGGAGMARSPSDPRAGMQAGAGPLEPMAMHGSSSGPMPIRHQGSGSGPMPLSPQGLASFPMPPMHPSPGFSIDVRAGSETSRQKRALSRSGPGTQRLYLVMSAVFVLLLAGAATITLVITG